MMTTTTKRAHTCLHMYYVCPYTHSIPSYSVCTRETHSTEPISKREATKPACVGRCCRCSRRRRRCRRHRLSLTASPYVLLYVHIQNGSCNGKITGGRLVWEIYSAVVSHEL